ncbi:MAG TPA: hypothetical protein VGN97_02335 [Mesorhizobium sp.]|jgi:hypothetical protein|nr:hypothetical protein [Mesorhizobium sp.]
MARNGDNPAQIKGDISKGLTGDKRPGYDPGLSSLETDSETGGFPLTPEQVRIARETQRSGAPAPDGGIENGGDYHDAMLPIEGSPREPGAKGPLFVMFAVGAAAAAAAIGAFLLT